MMEIYNDDFNSGAWNRVIDVRDFILRNFSPYYGDDSFLTPPTERTKKLWAELKEKMEEERVAKGHVLDIDENTISTINSHKPGYINKDLEQIVGLQTDAPLKRAIMPFGGIRLVKTQLATYERELPADIDNVFKYRKTHNDGVFDAYTDEMKLARHAGIITGLPDAYGRGRIIGDYRRVALYGTAFLIEQKKHAKDEMIRDVMDSGLIQKREETAEQIKALHEFEEMAASYGFDVTRPAQNFKEAVQWLYLGYLAAVKEQNGAAMSIGRISTFLDCFAENDLRKGIITESEVQEIVDHFIMKLRIVRFLRVPAYDELFSGDPTWVTESIGGMSVDGRPLVTKMSFRFLHTLRNLGPAPEPNLTVLWSQRLPEGFKRFCAEMSIKTSSIQYENDDLMRSLFGDDYGIACCVSAMRIGKQMQFFGARVNLAKTLLYAINGGMDVKLDNKQVGPELRVLSDDKRPLDFVEVMVNFEKVTEWLAKLYMDTLNIIHYMHDKYCYERIEMALHDDKILRTMAGGIAGLSVLVDSLSAIKYAKVTPICNESGLAVEFKIEGDFPKFGNDDDRVDQIAVDVVRSFYKKFAKHHAYREAKPTISILTITSNVMYGKKTASTPDGRMAGEPFAPGANPMHGRDTNGAVASLRSVSKLPYHCAEDGISNTFSIVPESLGANLAEQRANLIALMDGYFADRAHHLNVNVLDRNVLLDAMDHPEKYPQLTIRVSGYAVNFVKLTREQQMDVISRTFHEKL